MSNHQISSSDLVKITFFLVLSIPFIFPLIWGVFPSLFLLIGFFISKRDKKINVLEKAITLCKFYILLTAIIIIGVSIYTFINDDDYRQDPISFIVFPMVLLLLGLLIYFLSLSYLFYKPLIVNSYFLFKNETNTKNLNILGSENLKSYSVADELLKWKSLKDQGLISEKEFEEMKKKIIGS